MREKGGGAGACTSQDEMHMLKLTVNEATKLLRTPMRRECWGGIVG